MMSPEEVLTAIFESCFIAGNSGDAYIPENRMMADDAGTVSRGAAIGNEVLSGTTG
jgi:hypothetical protein